MFLQNRFGNDISLSSFHVDCPFLFLSSFMSYTAWRTSSLGPIHVVASCYAEAYVFTIDVFVFCLTLLTDVTLISSGGDIFLETQIALYMFLKSFR